MTVGVASPGYSAVEPPTCAPPTSDVSPSDGRAGPPRLTAECRGRPPRVNGRSLGVSAVGSHAGGCRTRPWGCRDDDRGIGQGGAAPRGSVLRGGSALARGPAVLLGLL